MFIDRPLVLLHDRETIARVVAAYPSSLAGDVRAVLRVLPRAKWELTRDDIGAIEIEGEPVSIPYRVHFPEPSPRAVGRLSPGQRLILATLFTRYHDGYVRERYVKQVVAHHEPWTVPFVVQLLSEYVVEIAEALEASGELRKGCYSDFAQANPAFCRRACALMVTYWDLYYRRQYPVFKEYAAFRVARETGVWQGRIPRRRRQRYQARATDVRGGSVPCTMGAVHVLEGLAASIADQTGAPRETRDTEIAAGIESVRTRLWVESFRAANAARLEKRQNRST